MADMRLLAELYNYMLCNSAPVFEALHTLLALGHSSGESHLDPPTVRHNSSVISCRLKVQPDWPVTGCRVLRLFLGLAGHWL